MKIGSHVNNNGKEMLLGSINEALSYGENCFMIYLGAPQNTFRKPIELMHVQEMYDVAQNNGILIDDIIVHAPYIVNLGQSDNDKHQYAIDVLTREMKLLANCGLKYIVLHPGAHVGFGSEKGILQIASGINDILNNTYGDKTVILLETMAGKGTECGKSFDEIKHILDLIVDQSRVGVCFDTCHVNDAGYDLVNKYEEVFNEFDEKIGLGRIKAFHINDSKNSCGSHKDRHENFGFGSIGFDTLLKVIYDHRFENIPKILETPYVDDKENKESYPPYKEEILMIKSKKFNTNLLSDVINKNQ